MKYYKDNQGDVYAYEADGSQDELIGDKTPMTDEEVQLHLNPPPPPVTMNMVNNAVQKLTDKRAVDGGFKNMNDVYNWVIVYQDVEAKALQVWDKSCWDAVDALNGIAPLDLDVFLNTL